MNRQPCRKQEACRKQEICREHADAKSSAAKQHNVWGGSTGLFGAADATKQPIPQRRIKRYACGFLDAKRLQNGG